MLIVSPHAQDDFTPVIPGKVVLLKDHDILSINSTVIPLEKIHRDEKLTEKKSVFTTIGPIVTRQTLHQPQDYRDPN